ncbi:MAG: ATP-binding protein [Thermodesulfobacteriota bacterium]
MAARRQLPDIMTEALGRLAVVEASPRPRVAPPPESAAGPDEQELAGRLAGLRLCGMAQALREQSGRPRQGGIAFGQRLAGLLDAEEAARTAKRAAVRLRRAGLTAAPGLDQVRCLPERGLSPALWAELVAGAWRLGRRNLLICGPTGVGKTFLAQALGREACRQGQEVLYKRLPNLARDLEAAARRGRLAAMLKRLARLELLILDDLGLAKLADGEIAYIYEVIESRLGLRPTLVASLLPLEAWPGYLGGDHLAAALVDRLSAGALTLALRGESWRGRS